MTVPGAGASAHAEYRRRRRARTVRGLWLLPLVVLLAAAAGAVLAHRVGTAAGVVLAAAIVFAHLARTVRASRAETAWRIGARGERDTARCLRRLERRGATVLHDRALPRSRANVDHVVITRTRVYAVDTKRWRRDARVHVRNGTLWCGDVDHARTLATARWIAERVSAEVSARAGLGPLEVTPVIAVHGATVRRGGFHLGGVLVVSARELPRALRPLGSTRSGDRVKTIAEAVDVALMTPGRKL